MLAVRSLAEPGRLAERPDPLLTANLYLSGHLDEAVWKVAAPFWQSLETDPVSGPVRFWLMRYSRRGEHLKLRIHAPDAERDRLRQRLADTAAAFLDAFAPSDPKAPEDPAPRNPAPRNHQDAAAPIDAEDEGSDLHPDGTLLWTTYRRNPVCLGEEPLGHDDGYTARLTECFSRGTDWMLAGMLAAGDEPLRHQRAQGLLVQALVHGLGVWTASPELRSRYFRYHRDWLLRTLARRSGTGGGAERLQKTLDRFNQRLASLGDTIQSLRDEMAGEAAPSSTNDPPTQDRFRLGWRGALEQLHTYLEEDLAWPERALDPFAAEPSFVPLFKVLHGLANQLGLSPLNEAFTHHLLLAAITGEETGGAITEPVRMVPHRRESSHQGAAAAPASGLNVGLTQPSGSDRSRFEAFVHADLLELCGEEARRWIEEFRLQWPLAELAFGALGDLRKHDLDGGRQRLAELETALRALDGIDPSIHHFLWRWYFAALAYHAYLCGDLEEAGRCLDRADRAVASAVGGHPFLALFALHCVDFRFQRARIARRERRWDEVRRHLDAVRGMWTGEVPFCRLDDGRAIRLAEIREFCSALPLSPEQRRDLAHILDQADLRSIDQVEEQIHVLPDFVIPYP